MFESKFLKTVLLAGFIVGGIWLLANRDKLNGPQDVLTFAQDTFSQWTSSSDQPTERLGEGSMTNGFPQTAQVASSSEPGSYPDDPRRDSSVPSQFASFPVNSSTVSPRGIDAVIRIASFRLNRNVTELRSQEPIQLLAEICRQYDIVVLQNIDRNDTTWLKSVTDQMNLSGAVATRNRPALPDGRRSDYVAISDRMQRNGPTQTAMIFNRQTIQLDHNRWYLVNDPDEVFQQDPMVAWFRTTEAPTSRAFTFSLVSLEIDQVRPDKELLQLGLLVRAVRNDGRGEDDVILVGDVQSDDRGLEFIRNQAGFAWVVSRRATTVRGDRQYDNILFSEPVTREFTGRGGVIEFHKQYQLQIQDALSVSDRLPVWAEFSITESF